MSWCYLLLTTHDLILTLLTTRLLHELVGEVAVGLVEHVTEVAAHLLGVGLGVGLGLGLELGSGLGWGSGWDWGSGWA